MGTSNGLNGNHGPAIKTLFGNRHRGRRFRLSLETVDLTDHQKNNQRYDNKIDDGIDEQAIFNRSRPGFFSFFLG